MTKEQVLMLLKYMNSYYRNRFEIPANKDELKMMLSTWYDFLDDVDFKAGMAAAKKLMTQKEWPPTAGEIAWEAKKMLAPAEDRLTAGEAWRLVLDSIDRYGVHYGLKEAEASLPPRVLKAANCVGGLYAIGMSDENDTYYMNQFMRVYRELSEVEEMDNYLPAGQEANLLEEGREG